jgi:tripartite-type tricarboxylate transporter receptor subunit TctC
MSARKLVRIAFAAWVIAAAGPGALAQPVTRIVVGGPPGGLFDNILRPATERLEKELGTTVVIDNKPGAGGTLAAEVVRTAKPDGLTLGMINVSTAANESIVKGKTYKLLNDFEPVGQYVWPANILIVTPSLQANNLAALIEVLKTKSDTTYSSGGVGSPGHLSGEMFKTRTGVSMTHVPYKGAPPAVAAVVTGEVSLMFATATSAIGQVTGGRVRALAVTTAERLRQLPDVPTVAEAGLADFNVADWVGVIAPKDTPLETRERIHRAMVAAFSDPQVQERLRNGTLVPASKPMGPAQFGEFLKSEVEKWAKVVREAKISQN